MLMESDDDDEIEMIRQAYETQLEATRKTQEVQAKQLSTIVKSNEVGRGLCIAARQHTPCRRHGTRQTRSPAPAKPLPRSLPKQAWLQADEARQTQAFSGSASMPSAVAHAPDPLLCPLFGEHRSRRTPHLLVRNSRSQLCRCAAAQSLSGAVLCGLVGRRKYPS